MMGEATFSLTDGEFDTRKLDRIRVEGKEQPVVVYEVLGPKGTIDQRKADMVGLYQRAFDAYVRQEFESALTTLDELLRLEPDHPADVLKERCREFLHAPPGSDWDGVYTMTSK